MVGAAIGSAVGGIMGASAASDANKNAEAQTAQSAEQMRYSQEMSGQAVDTAEQQLQYQRDMMNQYMQSMQGGTEYMAGLDWGGGLEGGGQEGVDFAQGMLDNWESTFGGIQDNLSDYYSNLDPTKFATQNKAQLSASMDKQMSQFNETMAASGLQSAGMKQQTAKEAMFRKAEGNAAIDINAPEQVAQMQQGFLQMGQGQQSQAQGMMGSALQNQSNQAWQAQKGNEQARVRQSGAMGDAYNRAGTSYRDMANMNNPLIGAYQSASGNALSQAGVSAQNAANYGNSAAGYMGASGSMFGSAMKLGIEGYNNPTDLDKNIFGM